jgi:Rrf2 family iron-sulfur cluster assembly transcriptional regulator
MKLTTKGRYAVMAMADLASNENTKPVSLNEIAMRQNISLSYLEQLFFKLKNDHLVKSVRGSRGGYLLAKKAKDIKLSNIISAVDEKVKTLNCKKDSKRGCNGRSVKCITHYLWDDLEKHINSFFENKNLKELVLKQENILTI